MCTMDIIFRSINTISTVLIHNRHWFDIFSGKSKLMLKDVILHLSTTNDEVCVRISVFIIRSHV